MAVIEIPVRSDFKAYTIQVDLEGVTYTLNFRFNTRLQNWVMDIADAAGTDLLNGVVLLTNVALTSYVVKDGLPPGKFICIDESGANRDAGIEDLGNDVKLLYEESG